MIAKKLLTTIAFAFVLLFSGCAEDDFNEIDTVCPLVISTNPDNLATDVPVNQIITATFNEKMSPASITEASFTVGDDVALIDGTVTYTDSTAVFTPSSLLDLDTEYTGTITTLAKDIRGNYIQEDYVWTFTTVLTVENFSVNLSPSPTLGGVTTGSGQFDEGSLITITATPNVGYTFDNWTENEVVVSTSANYEFILTGNRTLVANYSLIPGTQFDVNTSALPIAGGTTNGSGSFDAGTDVTVTATANTGYSFVNWTVAGVEVSTNATYTFALGANTTLVANFEVVNTFSLNVTAAHGTVVKNPDNLTYNNGDIVELTATPDSGYEFNSWSGDATGSNNPLTVTMNGNKNITANFYLIAATGSYPAGVVLGSAGDFAILGGSGVSNTGTSTVITGDVGSFPTATINGLLPSNVIGTLYTSADPIVGLAKDALTVAYNDAQSRSLDAISLPGQLGGLTLAPGLYVNSSTSGISGTGANGILTLDAGGDANAVWIFKMGSTLITDAGTSIVLAGGANAANIYWSVGTSATLGTNSIFYGNILADQAITLTTGAVLNGRALTRIAQVTLDSNIVTKP
ncbi:MAG: hypothetical protein CVU08_13555 [Bacteroidetes bacterium HGW-Bacteroidetes-3]|nr:MAG: hypothetical protein CVU08_13555 [Bacteroidetes bacterium HGW-Bacteroidetes-3]